MNKQDAAGILYPILVDKEEPVEFVVGKYYIVDGDVMIYEGVRTGYLRAGRAHFFKGIPMETRVLREDVQRDRDALLRAVPALAWEVREYRRKEKLANECSSEWFDRFGCD